MEGIDPCTNRELGRKMTQVSMAFDSMTGELIELVNMKNGDNLLKNWSALKSMPFSIEVRTTSGATETLTLPKQNLLLKKQPFKARDYHERDRNQYM